MKTRVILVCSLEVVASQEPAAALAAVVEDEEGLAPQEGRQLLNQIKTMIPSSRPIRYIPHLGYTMVKRGRCCKKLPAPWNYGSCNRFLEATDTSSTDCHFSCQKDLMIIDNTKHCVTWI
eukprot:scaffold4420_cov187-Amphora_coffeaeformis.AAC.24